MRRQEMYTLLTSFACGMAPLVVKRFVLLSPDRRQKSKVGASVIERQGEEKTKRRRERFGRLI